MALDISLDDTHDVYIIGDDLATTPDDYQTLQEIGIRLNFWRGEWFLDIQEGIQYLDEVFRKGANLFRVAALFKAEILEADGVSEIIEFSIDYNDRVLTIEFKVRADIGLLQQSLEVTV